MPLQPPQPQSYRNTALCRAIGAACLMLPLFLHAAGGGTPKMMKVLIPADKIPFSKVMDAVRSNTRDQGGDGSVTLVLERVDNSRSGSNGGCSVPDQGVGQMVVVPEGGQGVEGAVFDPRIFNSTFE